MAIERLKAEGRSGGAVRVRPLWRGFGIRDGNGVMCVSHRGDVHPSGFLPLAAGDVRVTSPVEIYRDVSLFRILRAPECFGGKMRALRVPRHLRLVAGACLRDDGGPPGLRPALRLRAGELRGPRFALSLGPAPDAD